MNFLSFSYIVNVTHKTNYFKQYIFQESKFLLLCIYNLAYYMDYNEQKIDYLAPANEFLPLCV